jgi:hypothetical protein
MRVSLKRDKAILCWLRPIWATRSVRPLYISKRGAVYLSGSSALSICLEKGEEDARSRAFQTACCPPGRAVFLEVCSFVC